MYQAANNGTSWVGINRENWNKYYQYYLNYNAEEEFSYDWEFIIKYIDNKLSMIDKELAINDTDVDVSPMDSAGVLVPGNLWCLNLEQVMVQQEIDELEQNKQQLEEQAQPLESNRQQELEVWNTPLSDLANQVSQANNTYQLDKLNFDVAHIEKDSFVLEFKLTDIERAQNELANIIQQLASMNLTDALAHYESKKEVILHANVNMMMKHKEQEQDTSGLELQKRIAQNLLEKEQAYKELKAQIDLEEVVPGQQQLLTQLAQAIEELKQRSQRIDQSLVHLAEVTQQQVQIINEIKQQILAYKELTDLQLEIETNYSLIINNRPLSVPNKEARDALILSLDAFISTRIAILADFNSRNHDGIKLLYNKLAGMAYQLSTEFTKLRLIQMEDEYPLLIERFKGIKTIGQRAVLLRDVALIQKRDEEFLRAIENPVSDVISEKLKVVTTLLVQLNFYNNELKLNDKYPEESDEEKLQREYEIRLRIVSANYYGTEHVTTGVFPDYLYERSITYWFYDLFTNATAFVLGCFGYKSDSQNRQEYIQNTLKTALESYIDADSHGKRAAYEDLISVIETGQRLFQPRVAKGEQYHDYSLCHKLELLKKDLVSVHEILDHKALASIYR